MRRIRDTFIFLAAAVALFALPAMAQASPEQVIRDCAKDGKLDQHYSLSDLKKAEKKLPTDVDEYTNCRDVINQAEVQGSGGNNQGSSHGGGSGGGASGGSGGGPSASASDVNALNHAKDTGGKAPSLTLHGEKVIPGSGGVFKTAGVALARLAPGSWSVLLKGLLLGAGTIVVYALASRVWPGSLAANEIYARIGQPYGYWNAVGVTAALAIPPAVWLGARRSGHAPANAIAYPLLGLLIVALFLSYSRGALGAAVVALIVWFAFVPLRVRSLAVLGVSVVGSAPVVGWALHRDAFTKDLVPLSVRESAAGEFGMLLLTTAAVLLAVGLIIGFRVSREAPSPWFRGRVGLAAVSSACLVTLVG